MRFITVNYSFSEFLVRILRQLETLKTPNNVEKIKKNSTFSFFLTTKILKIH